MNQMTTAEIAARTPTVSKAGRYDVTVFIGRFQPYHLGHHKIVTEALERSDTVVILVGSVFEPRNPRNPFTYEERRDMIMLSVPPEQRSRIRIRPILDWTYMGNRWLVETKRVVNEVVRDLNLDRKARVALIGHSKDASSYYLNMFKPDWESINVGNYENLDSTFFRNIYFSNAGEMKLRSTLRHEGERETPRELMLPDAVHQFLEQFITTDAYKALREETEWNLNYRAPFTELQFPPVFQTVDAAIVHRGKILLVKRRALPGKGLWALPGGYLVPGRTLLDSILIEIKEETNLKVPPSVLLGSLVWNREFDDPYRSARGRVITQGYAFQLSNDMEQPKVRGKKLESDDEGDPDGDTEYAQWFDLSDVTRDMMFEDHWYITQVLTANMENKTTPTNLRRN